MSTQDYSEVLAAVRPSLATTGGPLSLAGDLVWGVKEIAKEIGKNERQTYHLIETKQLPVGKSGGRYVASRVRLRGHFASITA